MAKSKGKQNPYIKTRCCFSDGVLLPKRTANADQSLFLPPSSRKKGGSNGARGAGDFHHLAMEGSSLSDLESEDELQIDETPPPPRRKPTGPSKKKKKLSGKN